MTPEQLIEKYFKTGLSKEEQAILDGLLKDNLDLAQSFQLEKDLKAALIARGKDHLKKELEQLEMLKRNQEYEKKSTTSFLKYAVAAAIIIGVSLFAVKSFSDYRISSEQLYAQYYEPYRNVIAPIERGTTALSDEEMAFQAYELKKYDQAAQDFTRIYEESKKGYLLFYRGIAFLEQGKVSLAILDFKKHQEQEDTFYDRSRWYLALAYLKQGDTQMAKTQLESITGSSTFKQEDAAALLQKL